MVEHTPASRKFYASRPIAAAVLALSVSLIGTIPAAGQVPVIRDRDGVAVCVCLGRSVDEKLREMNARRALYDQARANVARLEADLESARKNVDVNDPAAVTAFRENVLAFDAARQRTQDNALPDYARAGEYARRCAGKALDPAMKADIERNLVCRLD
jgi:hypothetical protein